MTHLIGIWHCLLGYDISYWDMTLLTGYDTSYWDMTLLTGIWHILLGYDTAYWIWHILLGYDTAYWDMTLLTGMWHCLLHMTHLIGIWHCLLDMTHLIGIWHCVLDMTYLIGIWHCLLGYDTADWDVTLLTGYWLLIIWEKIVISSSTVKMSNKNCWRWDHCAVSKFWEPIIQWCGIPFEKNGYLIHTTVKSLKPAENIWFIHLTMNCEVFWHK